MFKPPSDARAALLEQLRGHQVTALLYVAAKLRIADMLRGVSLPSAALAPKLEVDERSLYRVLRGLVVVGALHEDDAGCFSLTETGALLCADDPGSLRDDALLAGDLMYATFGALLETVRTGQPGIQ